MSKRKQPGHLFHSAADERRYANPELKGERVVNEQMASPAYRLAYDDIDFLLRDELRPVRFLLEVSKPELLLKEHGIDHTVVIFGSARTPDMVKRLDYSRKLQSWRWKQILMMMLCAPSLPEPKRVSAKLAITSRHVSLRNW